MTNDKDKKDSEKNTDCEPVTWGTMKDSYENPEKENRLINESGAGR